MVGESEDEDESSSQTMQNNDSGLDINLSQQEPLAEMNFNMKTPKNDDNDDDRLLLVVGICVGVICLLLFVLVIVILLVKKKKAAPDSKSSEPEAKSTELTQLGTISANESGEYASFKVSPEDIEYTEIDLPTTRNYDTIGSTFIYEESEGNPTALYGDVSQMLAESEARGNSNYGQRPVGKTGDHYGQL